MLNLLKTLRIFFLVTVVFGVLLFSIVTGVSAVSFSYIEAQTTVKDDILVVVSGKTLSRDVEILWNDANILRSRRNASSDIVVAIPYAFRMNAGTYLLDVRDNGVSVDSVQFVVVNPEIPERLSPPSFGGGIIDRINSGLRGLFGPTTPKEPLPPSIMELKM